MKFARINETNTCAEFINFEPTGKFHPSIQWAQVPEHLEQYADYSYTLVNGAIEPPSLDYLREQVKGKLAEHRFAKETAGITLADGTKIKADRESQAQLSGAHSSLKNGLIASTTWKAENGWSIVTLTEIEPIAQAVAAHVSSCFEAEKTVSDQIDLLETAQEIAQFDFTAAFDIEMV